jgi:hypothetical protein
MGDISMRFDNYISNLNSYIQSYVEELYVDIKNNNIIIIDERISPIKI